MALSDYMPYGAPELLAGASPRMASSTFAASTLVAAIVCCLGLVTANRATVTAGPGCWKPHRVDTLDQFTIVDPPSGGMPAPRVPDGPASEFRPVSYEPPDVVAIDGPAFAGLESSPQVGEPDAIPAGGGGDVAPTPDPVQGVYVYTDELPQLVRGVKPVYPDLAREAGVEGTVKLDLLIGLHGHVVRAVVHKGGSVPMLDDAAITAGLATVFTPALANNRPVKVWVAQDYLFTLH